jgi:hypothetical protein
MALKSPLKWSCASVPFLVYKCHMSVKQEFILVEQTTLLAVCFPEDPGISGIPLSRKELIGTSLNSNFGLNELFKILYLCKNV